MLIERDPNTRGKSCKKINWQFTFWQEKKRKVERGEKEKEEEETEDDVARAVISSVREQVTVREQSYYNTACEILANIFDLLIRRLCQQQ